MKTQTLFGTKSLHAKLAREGEYLLQTVSVHQKLRCTQTYFSKEEMKAKTSFAISCSFFPFPFTHPIE